MHAQLVLLTPKWGMFFLAKVIAFRNTKLLGGKWAEFLWLPLKGMSILASIARPIWLFVMISSPRSLLVSLRVYLRKNVCVNLCVSH